MRRSFISLTRQFLYLAALVTLVACGNDSGSDSGSGVDSLTGYAIKGPINGAEIKMFYFDQFGQEIEVVAKNKPVITDSTGLFSFEVPFQKLPTNVGPAIMRTVGGTTDPNNGVAPVLETVIPDLDALKNSSEPLSSSLSAASSVAAGLLKLAVINSGAAPSVELANEFIERVEFELGVNLKDDPSLITGTTAAMNSNIDALLSLKETPNNNAAINDYVDYLTANLASSSGKLDGNMVDPNNPDLDVPASLNAIGTGSLAALFPDGLESLRTLSLVTDKIEIQNNGLDTALLTVSLRDGMGELITISDSYANNPNSITLTYSVNNAIIGTRTLSQLNDGKLQFSVPVRSINIGPITVEAKYTLANDNVITQVVLIDVIDPATSAIIEPAATAAIGQVATATIGSTSNSSSDKIGPKIVSAVAISNTEIIINFTEALQGGPEGAENPAYYSISTVTDNGQTEFGARLDATSAVLLAPNYNAVLLTTQSQSGVRYTLEVSNLRDLAGNSFAPRETGFEGIDPSSTTFIGRPPSGVEIVDTDGDGLSDSDELFGWPVTRTSANGREVTQWVTSDPFNADTDGDGVNDAEESHGALNPRTADSDGDTLTDDEEWNTIFSDGTKQDTDGDGIQDGFEYKFYRTSPILADTDGDQMSDPDEVFAGNRDPLISDLPSPQIQVGNVNLELDSRYTFVSERGTVRSELKSTAATLTSGEDKSFSTSNENSTKNTIALSIEVEKKGEVGFDKDGLKLGSSLTTTSNTATGYERGSTFKADQASSQKSEEAYEDSLTFSAERNSSESETSEVEGASIKVDVSIENGKNLPFTINNLELSVFAQDPNNRRKMISVASLTPENTSLDAINIGALGDPSRGPFIFINDNVFPQQIENLMKNPRGLIVKLANYDITDESGRNFAYTSQNVLDRTAGISFDLGNGKVESYRVATNSAHDRNTGRPLGITMEYALKLIGLERYETIRDGGNGIVETTALGNDNSNFTLGESIEPGTVIINYAGNDSNPGKLASSPGGDDVLVMSDYETAVRTEAPYILDGGNGISESAKIGDDELMAGPISPNQVLITAGTDGVLDSEPNSPFQTCEDICGLLVAEEYNVCVDNYCPVPKGDDIAVTSLVPAHSVLTRFHDIGPIPNANKFWVLFASKSVTGIDLDKIVLRAGEQYDFTFVQDKDNDKVWAREEYLYGSDDQNPDTDGDGLNDNEEIQQGWRVQLKNAAQANLVYPNPNQVDSDRDGLTDHQEKTCGLDPRQRDSDLDGLTDYEELYGVLIDNGVDENPMLSRDPITYEIKYEIVPYTGKPDTQVSHPAITACSDELNITGFATDPLNPDTDGDNVNDGQELQLGINPNDASDGATYLDEDGDGVADYYEITGFDATINAGASPQSSVRVGSNPFRTDSDNDGLPDLLEHRIGSNPQNRDTDGDSIVDFDEYKIGGNACITPLALEQCKPFNENQLYRAYVNDCANAAICNNETVEKDVASYSKQTGTNLNEADSDFDGLTDYQELILDSGMITVNGKNVRYNKEHTDALNADSDDDRLSDIYELYIGTDPTLADTDGDGRPDGYEVYNLTDPTHIDKRFSLSIFYLAITKDAVISNGGVLTSADSLMWTMHNSDELWANAYPSSLEVNALINNITSYLSNGATILATGRESVPLQNFNIAQDQDVSFNFGKSTVTLNTRVIQTPTSTQPLVIDYYQSDIIDIPLNMIFGSYVEIDLHFSLKEITGDGKTPGTEFNPQVPSNWVPYP